MRPAHRSIQSPSSDVRKLAPGVDGDRFPVPCAEDAPVAVGFTADDDDLDLVALEHVDELVGRDFELAGVGLLAVRGARVDVVLDELVIPVFTGRHARVVVDPIDQLVLGVETAAVDEQSRRDRVQHQTRLLVRIHTAQHAADVVLPVRLPQAERKRGVAAAAEHADGAVSRLKAVLDMQRFPRAALLVLGVRDAGVGVVVALRAQISEPRLRAALEILREQSVRAPDGGVGVVVGPSAPVPLFMPISLRIGPLTTTIAAAELVVLARPETPLAAMARITGKYSGEAPAMTALTATFSTVYSQYSRNWVGRMWPTTSSG